MARLGPSSELVLAQTNQVYYRVCFI